jgi:hypothetical protein
MKKFPEQAAYFGRKVVQKPENELWSCEADKHIQALTCQALNARADGFRPSIQSPGTYA